MAKLHIAFSTRPKPKKTFIKNSKVFSAYRRLEDSISGLSENAVIKMDSPQALLGKGVTKRQKKDPPSPPKSTSPVSMEMLLDEIRALRPFIEETNSKIQSLTDHWSQLDTRISAVEHKVDSFAEIPPEVSLLKSQVSTLQRQVEELENRNRRNNLRIYGLQEGSEGADPLSFFRSFLPKLLHMPDGTALNIQRAHRLGHPSAASSSSPRPRGVILYFLEYTDLLKVLSAARSAQRVTWSGHTLFFAQDYAKATANRRKAFLNMRPELRALGARYGLFHPCVFKVTHNNKTVTYEDPVRLQSFINSHRIVAMDSSTSSSLHNA